MSPPLEDLPRPPLNRLDCFYPYHFMTATKSAPRSRTLLFGEKDIAVTVFYPRSGEGFWLKQAKWPVLSFHPMTQYASSNSSHKMMWIKTILNIYFYYLFFFNQHFLWSCLSSILSALPSFYSSLSGQKVNRSHFTAGIVPGIPVHHEEVANSLSTDLCVLSVFSLRCSYTLSV